MAPVQVESGTGRASRLGLPQPEPPPCSLDGGGADGADHALQARPAQGLLDAKAPDEADCARSGEA